MDHNCFCRALFIGIILLASCVSENEPRDAGFSAGDSTTHDRDEWVGVYSGPRVLIDANYIEDFSERSLRVVVRPTLGGEMVRVGFSNLFGQQPLTIQSVKLARSKIVVDDDGIPIPLSAEIDSSTDNQLTFSGRSTVTIAALSDVLSDPLPFRFSFGDYLAVSFYVGGTSDFPTLTRFCIETLSALSKGNDAMENESDESFSTPIGLKHSCPVLSRIDVLKENALGTVIAIGDSITGGRVSPTGVHTNWPWFLAERINAAGLILGTLNMGIEGNTAMAMPPIPQSLIGIFDSGTERFQRDVVQQTNVRTVIIALGGNDIRLFPDVDTESIIASLQDMIDQGHAADMRVLLATIPPGTSGQLNPDGDDKRRVINEWIRNHRGIEGWLPFDETLRDPANLDRIQERYNASGDNVHPDEVGLKALAEVIPLDML